MTKRFFSNIWDSESFPAVLNNLTKHKLTLEITAKYTSTFYTRTEKCIEKLQEITNLYITIHCLKKKFIERGIPINTTYLIDFFRISLICYLSQQEVDKSKNSKQSKGCILEWLSKSRIKISLNNIEFNTLKDIINMQKLFKFWALFWPGNQCKCHKDSP